MPRNTLKALGQGNVQFGIEGDDLVLVIAKGKSALAAAGPSKSGKTRVLATTNGFQKVPGIEGIAVSLNVTIPNAVQG